MGLTTSLSLRKARPVQALLDQSRVPSVLVNKSTSRQRWPDRGESEGVTRKMKQTSPVRTFLHPMRTPLRMEQLEVLSTPLRLGDFLSRPLFKLCRFKCPSLVLTRPGWYVPAARWRSPPGPAPSPA